MSDTCPPFITMKLLRELFPDKHQVTVWRWNTAKAGRMRLPAPDVFADPVPVWSLDTILEWAEANGLRDQMDEGALSRISEDQLS